MGATRLANALAWQGGLAFLTSRFFLSAYGFSVGCLAFSIFPDPRRDSRAGLRLQYGLKSLRFRAEKRNHEDGSGSRRRHVREV